MEVIKSPIFKNFSKEEFEAMAACGCLRRESFNKGDTIFYTGDMVSEIGIVEKGSVNIENIDLLGNKSILSNVAAGSIFAESYAICAEPMMVDAVAAEAASIAFLNLSVVHDCKHMTDEWHGKLLTNLLQVAVRKNLTLSTRIFCTSGKTIRSRLLTYLTGQQVKAGSSTFQIPFDRQQLADYLNVDRSALSKELGKMKDEGIIDFYKSSFRLL